jgi:hypothetical protein
MTELTSTPLADAIVWSFDHRGKVLDETFKLFSGNITHIRKIQAPELKPSIFDRLREENVELIGSGRGVSMVELFESCD